MKQLSKHLQAPAGALSTDKALQVQKELFIRGTDAPAAIDEQTISPKSNGRLLTSKLDTLVANSPLTEKSLQCLQELH